MSTEGASSKATTSPRAQAQPVRHACTYQGFQGTLTADTTGCNFTSDLVKAEFLWENVKWIRVTTKYIKDKPTSVLVLKVKHGKNFGSRLSNSGKHYFYYLMDIVEASRGLQALKDAASASDAAVGSASPASKGHLTATANTTGAGDSTNTLPAAPNSNVSLANCNQANPASPIAGNTIPKADSPLQTGGKTLGSARTTSLNVLRQEDDWVSSSSTGRLRKAANPRDEGDEENAGRNGAGAGVNMPFLIGTQRHAEQKEFNSNLSQAQRCNTVAIINRRRRGRQREAGSTWWSRCRDWVASNFSEGPLHAVIALCIMLLVILALVLSLRLMAGLLIRENWPESLPEETVIRVTRGLEQLKQWRTEYHVGGAIRNVNRDTSATMMAMTTRSAPPVRVTLKDMTVAVQELLARYVAVQHEMIATRIERVRRENMHPETILSERRRLLDGVPLDSLQQDEGNWETMYGNERGEDGVGDAEAAVSQEGRHQQPPLRFSTARVKADLNRLLCYAREAIAVVKWIFSRRTSAGNHKNRPTPFFLRWLAPKQDEGGASRASKDGRDTQQLTRYAEVLANGQFVTQEVTFAERDERRKCLRLTRELIRLANLVEELLLEYHDVVMAPLYEAYLYEGFSNVSEVKGIHAAFGAAAVETLLRNDHEESGLAWGHNNHLLRSILLRRQALALLRFDPLSSSNGDQEYKATRRPHNPRSSSTSTSKGRKRGKQANSTSAPNKERVKAILQDFVASTTEPSETRGRITTENSAALMRNILSEMKYWYEHEEDWQTVVLWRLNSPNRTLNATQTPHGAQDAEKEAESDNDDFRKVIGSLPLFRGLWCFLKQPISFPQEAVKKKADVSSFSSSPVPSEYGQKGDAFPNFAGNECVLENENEIFKKLFAGGAEDSELVEEVCEWRENDTRFNSMGVQPPSASLVTMDPAAWAFSNEEHTKNDEVGGAGDETEATETWIRTVELISEEAQIRWLNVLDLFIRSHEDLHHEWAQDNRGWDWERPYEWGAEVGYGESNAAHARQRVIRLLGWAKHHYEKYLARDPVALLGSSGALSEFTKQCATSQRWSWWKVFWPPSWFLQVKLPQSTSSCWVLRPKHVDPAVRRLYRNVLYVRLGDLEDVPLMLLYTFSTPSELLESQYKLRNFFQILCWLLLLVVVVAGAIVVFLS
ncbi:uncharacterized protein Tco025E_02183 [Trypanosoma conorhini]|uniref:Transmembrane protein n=1 Tax=Trypanosoma conorhini TaxID=83891 RepID=A0A3R7LJ25_9TRYP|nr:uncharacterized protein Tco025E_02183 [Trypanosoma conorhini]RNF25594.1 hypothetical protein Tco025E_02183 [Trypanosoma conorhini]